MEGTPVSRCRRCDAFIPAGRFVHCQYCREILSLTRSLESYKTQFDLSNQTLVRLDKENAELKLRVRELSGVKEKEDAEWKKVAESIRKWPYWYSIPEQTGFCTQEHYQKLRTAFKDLELNYNGGSR